MDKFTVIFAMLEYATINRWSEEDFGAHVCIVVDAIDAYESDDDGGGEELDEDEDLEKPEIYESPMLLKLNKTG